MSSRTNSGVVTGNVRPIRRRLLLGQETGERQHRHLHREPAEEHSSPSMRVVVVGGAGQAGERAAVVRGGRAERVEDLGETVRAGVVESQPAPAVVDGRDAAVKVRIDERRRRARRASPSGPRAPAIFLPRYSGVRPTIRPAMKTVEHDLDEHAVEAGADAAEDDLAELHVDHRHQAADRRERVVHRVHRAARGVGRDRGEEGGVGDAEAHLLPFHVAAWIIPIAATLIPSRGMDRVAARLGPVRRRRRRRRKSTNIAAQTAQPCRWFFTIRPSMNVRPAGIMKIATICRKLVHGVGFSNGCAELALKNPPPLVPSCLIASWLATGPMEWSALAPSSVVACT